MRNLDTNYFRQKLTLVLRDLSHYTPQEMARELVRLAKVADESEAVKEAAPAGDALAAIKTLQRLGYTYHGAELWKPPLGKAGDARDAARYRWLRQSAYWIHSAKVFNIHGDYLVPDCLDKEIDAAMKEKP